ncbi:hypothetical protein QVD17_35856 [Tagetes erecta]|uniref:Uncharacterized protein n=1 Tax=Tagetes erecta TaxID=13708 RepID=A0AAD8JXE9_TARER|nr:hypothetical protein QVD17_35856 [Tagetes erecta]
MEEGDGSNSPALPKDRQLNDLTESLAENVEVFRQFVDEAIEAVDQDEKFDEMTAESYDQKKFYMKKHVQELSSIHNSLAGQYGDFIEEIRMYCQSLMQNEHLRLQSSESSSSPQVSQILGPKASTSTGFDVLFHPDGGGFYLAKCKRPSSHSGLKSSIQPVNAAALKVKETKDDALVEKISRLEEEVVSLKQRLQTTTVENAS